MHIQKRAIAHPCKDDGGYTLIEVLIALAIFSIGFMAVGSLQTASLMRTGDIGRKVEASTVLTDQVEQLKAIPFYDNNEDDDADGDPYDTDESDPWLQDTVAGNGFEFTNVSRADGRFEVHWQIIDDEPLAAIAMPTANLQDLDGDGNPDPITVSKTIRVSVTRPGGDPINDAISFMEFVKVFSETI